MSLEAKAKYGKSAKGRIAAVRWRIKNPNYGKQRAKEYRKEQPERVRAIRQKSRYKVEPSRPCPENCEGCSRPFIEASKHHGACFDHDHKTGEFRGWLCNDCNLALGYAKDNRDRLQLLINYLDRHELCR